MAVEDAVMAALLVVLSGALTLLSAATFRRHRSRPFLLLTAGFGAIFAEGLVLSAVALDAVASGGLWLSVIAAAQVLALVLVYAATLPPR